MNVKAIIKNSTLLHSFINLCVVDGVNYLLPFLALPFLYRTLGADTYGVIASAYSLFTFSIIVIDFGFGLSATRDVSLNVNDSIELNKIVNVTLKAKGILLLLVLIISAVVIECTSFREHSKIFYLMIGIPIGSCLFPVWFFQGMEKMSYMTTTTTLAKLLSFVPMFIIVRGPKDAEWVSFFYSCGFIVSGIISVIILHKNFGIMICKTKTTHIFLSLKNSAPYFLSRISASLYGAGNMILIGILCSTLIAGYYDSAQKLLSVFTAALAPLTTALYPYMIKRRNVKVFKKIFIGLGGVGFLISITCFLGAEFILKWLYGESPELTVKIFKILFLSTSFLIPSYLLGYPFLAALGHVKFTNMTVVIAGVIYLIAISLAIYLDSFSVIYASIIYVICEFIVFILRIYGVYKYKLIK